jgi:hypothetical protein
MATYYQAGTLADSAIVAIRDNHKNSRQSQCDHRQEAEADSGIVAIRDGLQEHSQQHQGDHWQHRQCQRDHR